MKLGETVKRDFGCPFCKRTKGTITDGGWDARRVQCKCGAFGPREWAENLVIKPWKADSGKPAPMWCTSCKEVIGDATFKEEVPITVKLRPKKECSHEVSCCRPARWRWREATKIQLEEGSRRAAMKNEIAKMVCSDCGASYYAEIVGRDGRYEIGDKVAPPAKGTRVRNQRILCGNCKGLGGPGDQLEEILRRQRGGGDPFGLF